MTTMLERVARAIYENVSAGADDMESCIIAARAAIEAMRVPTEAMVDAGEGQVAELRNETSTSYTAAETYRAMIDTALLEQQP